MLSALPIVSMVNVCCCLWVVSGGLLAAYLLQQNESQAISAADGAIVGLLAGVMGAVVQFVLNIPITILIGPMQRAFMQRFLDMSADMPPQLRAMLERASSADRSVAMVIVSQIFNFFFFLCIGAVFATLGGLLGAAIFQKRVPPPSDPPRPALPTTADLYPPTHD